MFDFLSRN